MRINNKNTEGVTQFHITKFHIFLNNDFTEKTRCFYPASDTDPAVIDYENHRVHIFFSKSNPSIGNGCLEEFVSRCKDACRRKVLIHVPKRNPELKKEIEEVLSGLPNWEMIFEKNTNLTLFSSGDLYNLDINDHRDSHPKCYLYVTWFPDDRIKTGFIEEPKEGELITIIEED